MTVAVASSSVNEQTTGTVNTCTTPTGTASGDLLVAFVAHNSNTVPANPGGAWVTVGQAPPPASQTVSQSCFRLTLSAAPAASYGFPVVSGVSTVVLVRVSGGNSGTPEDITATITSGTLATSVVVASATTVSANVLLLGGMAINGTTQNIAADAAMTEVNRSTGTGKRLVVAQEMRATAGATGTRTWTTPGTNTVWAGVRAYLRSAPSNLNKVKAGSSNVLLKVGSSAVSKAYVGSTQVWP